MADEGACAGCATGPDESFNQFDVDAKMEKMATVTHLSRWPRQHTESYIRANSVPCLIASRVVVGKSRWPEKRRVAKVSTKTQVRGTWRSHYSEMTNGKILYSLGAWRRSQRRIPGVTVLFIDD